MTDAEIGRARSRSTATPTRSRRADAQQAQPARAGADRGWACGAFLREGGFNAFTTTFEDLHGLAQLPGLAVQRLMADGYGFGAEGDWKTAALVRAMKVMASGLPGGTSFMEDYTYHLDPKGPKVLGAHMLEVCSSIAEGKPSLEVHPLGIGGKADPARLVFNVPAGPALNASLIDLGNRFRLHRQRGRRGDARTRRCRSCPWRARSGCRSPTSRSRPRPGSTPAARTTPASARR